MAVVTLTACGSRDWASGAAGAETPDPFEPSVSRKEAQVLRRVMDVGATNVAQAVELLMREDRETGSPALDFALGNLHFQAEKLDEAADAYQRALEKLPKFRRAITNLGRVLLVQEKTAAAIRLYQGLVKDGQADAETLILLGRALLLQNSAVSAETAFRQALLLSPDAADARLGLVKCLLDQERYREGVSLVGELLAADADRKEYCSLQANTYLALEKPADALVTLECARRLDLADSEMAATLGDLYFNADMLSEALSCYQAAFDGDAPDLRRLLRAAEGLILAGEAPEAATLLRKAEALKERTPTRFSAADTRKLSRLSGDLAYAQGDADSAVRIYEQLLREDPLDGRVLIKLGDWRRERGELESAVMSYERASRISGYEFRALVRQARVEVDRDRYKLAVELLEAAQAFDDQPHVTRYLEQVRRLAR